jgi:hypothetical protein
LGTSKKYRRARQGDLRKVANLPDSTSAQDVININMPGEENQEVLLRGLNAFEG